MRSGRMYGSKPRTLVGQQEAYVPPQNRKVGSTRTLNAPCITTRSQRQALVSCFARDCWPKQAEL